MSKLFRAVSVSIFALILLVGYSSPALAVTATTGAALTCDLGTSSLTIGSRGAAVTKLQQALVTKGYLIMPAGLAMGSFGPLTRTAVAKWQKAVGISPAVGYFGPLSRARAQTTLCGATGMRSTGPLESSAATSYIPNTVQSNITVSFPSNLSGTGDIEIPVSVSDLTGSNIIGGNFILTYDPSVLRITGYALSPLLTSANAQITLNPDGDQSGTVAGRLMLLIAGPYALSGSGTLFTLRGQTLATSGTSNLHWNMANFENIASTLIPNASDGTFRVAAPIASSTTPVLSLMTPNGGEVYNEGSPVYIQWRTAASGPSTVSINLVDANNTVVRNIVGNLVSNNNSSTNDHFYTWTIPTDLVSTGSQSFKIAVSTMDGSAAVQDASDSTFTVTNVIATEPSITLISPINGVSWATGSSHAITWSSQNLPANSLVNVYLRNNSKGIAQYITSYVPAGNGTFSWTLPTTLPESGSYTITLMVQGRTIQSDGNNVFTITNPTPEYVTPVIADIIANQYTVGTSEGALLRINSGGPSFLQGVSTIYVNGISHNTWYENANSIATYLTAQDVALTATSIVKVVNGDKSSNEKTIHINAINAAAVSTIPTITLTSPLATTTWTAGTNQTITWTIQNPQNIPTGSKVNIMVQNSATGAQSWITSGTVSATDGTYAWTIPANLVPATATDVQQKAYSIYIAVAGLTPTVQYMGDKFTIAPASSLPASAITALNNLTSDSVRQSTFHYNWTHDLQIGSPNQADVIALQTALINERVYSGEVTGGFYNQTFTAVKAFQEKYGIESTGFVGPITRAKLNELY